MEPVERDVFGSQEIAYECLADVERTRRFEAALDEVVALGDRVLELGTGTGILALMAARAGAEYVDAFEISVPMAEIAAANVAANGCDDTVTVRVGDVSRPLVEHRGPYDLLLAEMISVALIEEQLVPAVNGVIGQGLLRPTAKIVPARQDTWIELVDTDFDHFGFTMRTVQIEQTWQESKVRARLSAPGLVARVDLAAAVRSAAPVDPRVDAVVDLVAEGSGTVDAVRLTSESVLSDGVVSGWTQCMNSPAIVPVEPFDVAAGDVVTLRVAYEMGGEMRTFTCRRIEARATAR